MHKKLWHLFGFFVAFFAIFAWCYFDQAIPLVRVAITMDQKQAIEKSKLLAEQNNIDIANYRFATQYAHSSELQAFVELEAGGKQAFIEMIDCDDYQPYSWRVRFFKEKEAREVFFVFTPSGKPYEFLIKFPEDSIGASLSKDDALKIAVDGAKKWEVNLSNYHLIEHHKEEILSGRVDHIFTYQREDKVIGEGFYRIQLKVSGDVFSGILRNVKIPDEFTRRYAQMYATNTTLAGFAQNVAILLYLFVFSLFILVFFIQRKNSFLVFNVCKIFGLFCVLLGLNFCNKLPLLWYQYPTHLSSMFFIGQLAAGALFRAIIFSLIISFIVLVAETAGRYVFAKHLQFFKLWNWSVVGSYQVFQQTIIGYGSAVLFFGYNVGFYMLASKFGCWIPLSTLINPNILTSYMPSFSPLVTAFQAGFFEEFLCRALPLAGIMLLARNSKNKQRWFWLIFILQNLIFGGMHAFYPQQPAYYRIVELIIPSFGFGFLYLKFGLLPCIVSHFVYDAFFMSLPIFVSRLYIQQIFSVIVILLPLLVILIAWMRQGYKFKDAPIDSYNKAFCFEQGEQKHIKPLRLVGNFISLRLKCAALLFGCVGLMMIYFSDAFHFAGSAITITVPQAECIARTQIAQHFQTLGSEWKVSYKYANPAESVGAKFIWQNFGNKVYQQLQGDAIISPGYMVKFVKFEGSVEDRSEFFEILVGADGRVLSIKHEFPQCWKGQDLQESEVLSIAYQWIEKIYGMAREDLEIVACKSVKHQYRRDWSIQFKDVKNYQLTTGQVRIQVGIAGDQLSSIQKYVFASEVWTRQEQNRESKESLLRFVLVVIMSLCCLVFAIFLVKKFKISPEWFNYFILFVISFVLLKYAIFFSKWFEILYDFTTTQSFLNQLFNSISNQLVVFLGYALPLAVLVLGILGSQVQVKQKNLMSTLLLGFWIASGICGVTSFWQKIEPKIVPLIPINANSCTIWPSFYIFLTMMVNIIFVVVVLNSIFFVIERISGYMRPLKVSILLFMLAGVLLSSCVQLTDISVWIGSGFSLGLVWYCIYTYFVSQDGCLLWVIVSWMHLLSLFPSVWFNAYPGIIEQFIISSCLILGLIGCLYRKT
jgi:hypothetical protein